MISSFLRKPHDSWGVENVLALKSMDTAEYIQCPLCNDTVDKLLYRFHIDNERLVIERIKANNPGWAENDGACSRCVDYYHTEIVMLHRSLPEIGPYFPVKSVDDFIILPTGLRLDADPRFTGKGITICFIDSGFCFHSDLVAHRNRIRAFIDITKGAHPVDCSAIPDTASWHGTMTSVVCAGDGYLSNGLYKGIASDAELVLLKVQDSDGRVTDDNLAAALQWILENREVYNIRIVNMSVCADETISYKESKIDRLAELLIEKGIVVVAAVGNDERGIIKSPATSPNVIAVGGLDDENLLNNGYQKLYHSSFGKTVDGFTKPELLAHAIWIAAPILPGTKEEKEAGILYDMLQENKDLSELNITDVLSYTQLNSEVLLNQDESDITRSVISRIQQAKYISRSYMHVDGTSFAAPIVSAIVAQLLEARPELDPFMVREILFGTAKRVQDQIAERQGFGVVQPRKAILKVLKRENIMKPMLSPYVNPIQNTIEFYTQNDCASQISLAGSFNHWAQDVLLMEPGQNGIWKIAIPMLPQGRYYYKFLVDEKRWLEDIANPYREPDGFNGFNSILIVDQIQTT